MEYLSGLQDFGLMTGDQSILIYQISYTGNWKNDKKDGEGECKMNNGDRSLAHIINLFRYIG